MLREVELAQERAARAAHIDDAGQAFQQDLAALTATLSEMATKVEAVAGALSERAPQTGRDAVTVAGAKAQTLAGLQALGDRRSDEHTSELQSLMRTSSAFLCLQRKNILTTNR